MSQAVQRLHRFFRKQLLPAIAVILLLTKAGTILAEDSSPVVADSAASYADPELQQRFQARLASMPADYQPRTHHFNTDGSPTYLNRLILEDSPYLLQHAHNPVNWYAWGEEAFEAARARDLPIFISIGYATCHWCHVMERESFENEEIAEYLNNHYIAIKVDREQLPDIDAHYVEIVGMLIGRAGWPLSAFTDSDGNAFYGGTYFPPRQFNDLLQRVTDAWHGSRDELQQHANTISSAVARSRSLQQSAEQIGEKHIQEAIESLLQTHDNFQGGFGPAPKFPRETTLMLLLDDAWRNANGEALGAVHFSLQRMADGGIHDHLGGGFHRYAVDNEWIVPHFEKMLYTQALLSRVYLQTWQLTGNADHRRTLTRMLDYVLRDMTSRDGGFYSATDADSEGKEGTYFVWSEEELDQLLSTEDAIFARRMWHTSSSGNFDGENILHRGFSSEELPDNTAIRRLDRISDQLLEHRFKRIAPLMDTKVIVGWNALMISALAEAGMFLPDPKYIHAAVRAAERIFAQQFDDNGLLRINVNGRASTPSVQTDYAYLADAMTTLYDATGNERWLTQAQDLVEQMYDKFYDTKQGGFFFANQSAPAVTSQPPRREINDSTLPAGNGVALQVLSRLWWRTGNSDYRDKANSLITAIGGTVAEHPSTAQTMMQALAQFRHGEIFPLRYGARGKVKVNGSVQQNKLTINVSLADGWHVNSSTPNQEYLIPTRLSSKSATLQNIGYPPVQLKTLSFDKEPLSLFVGSFTITADLKNTDPEDGRNVWPVQLQLQACSNQVCLAPEDIILQIPVVND